MISRPAFSDRNDECRALTAFNNEAFRGSPAAARGRPARSVDVASDETYWRDIHQVFRSIGPSQSNTAAAARAPASFTTLQRYLDISPSPVYHFGDLVRHETVRRRLAGIRLPPEEWRHAQRDEALRSAIWNRSQGG